MESRRTRGEQRSDATGLAFSLLGPVRGWRDGEELDLGSPQQRSFLALLLLKVGQPVSISAIETALWGEFVPNTAKATIRTYVHRLRRTLGGGDRAGGSPVVSATGSYRLAVPPDAVDVTRFRTALVDASQEADAGVAAEGLRAALELWRGEPLDGIAPRAETDRNLFAEQRARLHHERVSATETLAGLEAGLGRYGAAIDLLATATRAEPLRQDLHEMLIDALHRAGQDTEALVAYEDIRHRLQVERGVEPSPRLRQLHGIITGGDTDGGRRQPPVAVPAQLPVRLPVFVGREQHIRALHSAVPAGDDPVPRVILIHGMPGVGKTALAVRWAQQVAERFPDGTLHVNLRGFEENVSVATADVLAGFLEALGVPAESLPRRERDLGALYRSVLADRRCLVVLDNAGDSEQVLPLLPGGQGNLTLVTSRGSLPTLVATTGARTERLDVLTEDEAHEFVAARLGPDTVAADPASVHGIVGLCARLPLALAVVCARAAASPGLPLRALIDELREADGSLDGFAGTEPSVDVRTVLSWSYRKLTEPAGRLFRLLALRPGRDFTARLAASVADVPLPQARVLLRELVSASLVTEYAPSSYEQHDLLRTLATELLRDGHCPADRDRALCRLVDHYLQSAHSAMRHIDYHVDHCSCPDALSGVVPHSATSFADAYDWFSREHASLRSIIRLAATEGLHDHAWRIAWAMGDFVELTGDVHELGELGAQARQAAHQAGSTEGLAYGHRLTARAAIFDGRLGDARADLDIAIASLDNLGDHRATGYAIRNLLSVLRLRGEYPEALGWAERARALFAASDCLLGEAVILTHSVTRCHVAAGRFEDAVTAASEALALCRKAQPPAEMGMADCHNVLGRLHQLTGRDDEAAHHHRQALDLYSDNEATSIETPLWVMRMRAETMAELATVYRTTGNGGAADTVMRDALALYLSILTVTPAVHETDETAATLAEAVARLERALGVASAESHWRALAQEAEDMAVAAMYRLRRDIEFRDQLLVSVTYPSGRRGKF